MFGIHIFATCHLSKLMTCPHYNRKHNPVAIPFCREDVLDHRAGKSHSFIFLLSCGHKVINETWLRAAKGTV